MTLSDLEATLPWGLHDAHLESMKISWPRAELSMVLRVPMSESQDLDQRARVVVSGLVYCSIEAPTQLSASGGYEPTPAAGLWLGSDALDAAAATQAGVPAAPDGCFLHRFFVQDWNRFIYICGRSAALTWLEPAPVPARSDVRALVPGDDITLPE